VEYLLIAIAALVVQYWIIRWAVAAGIRDARKNPGRVEGRAGRRWTERKTPAASEDESKP